MGFLSKNAGIRNAALQWRLAVPAYGALGRGRTIKFVASAGLEKKVLPLRHD